MELSEILEKVRIGDVNVREAEQMIFEIVALIKGRMCDECKLKGGDPLFIGSTIQ